MLSHCAWVPPRFLRDGLFSRTLRYVSSQPFAGARAGGAFGGYHGGLGHQRRMPREVGGANLDWEKLLFDYVPTKGHVRFTWKDGKWGPGSFHEEPYFTVHILANVFHYGQAIFEGCKAYHLKDGNVAVFYDEANCQRMSHSCKRVYIPTVPEEIFYAAVDEVLRQNVAYIPPYGTGGSMYLRPFVFGSGPKLGLGPSTEYTFCVFANPVGNYYKAGSLENLGLDGIVVDDYDRAAPLGSGDAKMAGNYAADLESMMTAKANGFPIGLYLDPKEKKYVEEFNTSNFIAITKDGRYVTPDSKSVLASVTNRILSKLAEDMGLKVERRKIAFEEEVDTFAEVGAVGTAVVLTPISSLMRGGKIWKFGQANVLKKLYDQVKAIQFGEAPDPHGWRRIVDLDLKAGAPGSLRSIYPPL